MARATEYVVIRQVSNEELRICRIIRGFVPPTDPAYTWGGPYPSERSARKAVESKSEKLRRQLYPVATAKEG